MSKLKTPTSPPKKVEKPKNAGKRAATTEAVLASIKDRQTSDKAN